MTDIAFMSKIKYKLEEMEKRTRKGTGISPLNRVSLPLKNME
jgi:hypothetical protein